MIKIVVISDDCGAHTGFGTVIQNLFGVITRDHSSAIDVKAIGLFPASRDAVRNVPTIPSPEDDHGMTTLEKIVNTEGQPDIIFLLGDWWYWSKTLLNRRWRASHGIFSSVWYYAPVDALQTTTIAKGAYDAADKLIAMSPFGEEMLKHYTGRRDIMVMPHGYDHRIYQHMDRPKRPFTFGVVSRNARRKNLSTIIQAYWQVAKKRECRLKIHTPKNDKVGGDLWSWLCAVGGDQPPVDWPDSVVIENKTVKGVDDMAAVYAEMDALVSAGREGFGLPFLEGRATGCSLVLPQYSAPFSMDYPDSYTYPVTTTKPDPGAPDVLDMVPVVDDVAKAMLAAMDGPDPRPLAMPLRWVDISLQLVREILKHGKSKALAQAREAQEFNAIPFCHLKRERGIGFVMPCSTGDVLLSLATVDSLAKKYGEKVEFITQPQYFPLLEGCPSISGVVEFNRSIHQNYNKMRRLYTRYYSPYFRTQVAADWVREDGPCLAQVYAQACGVELGDYHINVEPAGEGEYFTFHPGSGQGEQSARWYSHWSEVIAEIRLRTGLRCVEIGTKQDVLIDGAEDMRGLSYEKTHGLLKGAKFHLGIDSYPMHAAAILWTPRVIVWGNTDPRRTGPEPSLRAKQIDIVPDYSLTECDQGPCHLVQCPAKVRCIDTIDPLAIASAVGGVL